MNFIFKTLIAIVLFTGSALFAAPADNSFAQNEHTGQLVVGSYTPVPDEKILERWSLDFHEAMPETWVLTNFTLSEFVKIFMDGQASEELKQEIDKSISINLSLEQSLKLFSFINNPLLPQPGLQYSFVQLTPELKAKIPEPILSKVYQLLYKTGMSPRFQRFPTRDAMLKYYREQETTAQSLEIIEKNIFEINGELMVYIWPHVWSALSEKTKLDIINYNVKESRTNQGLQVSLNIDKNDDLELIAKKYGSNRAPIANGKVLYWKVIERYLRNLLRHAEGASVTVPLQKILQPFIRSHINTYPSCSGPNCHNSGLNVNEERDYKQEFQSPLPYLKERVFPYYDRVFGNDNLQTGDLLIYLSMDNKIVHTATYIGRNGEDIILFTKNGLQKTSPYIFATKRQVEDVYFSQSGGQFNLGLFRKKYSPEKILCSEVF